MHPCTIALLALFALSFLHFQYLIYLCINHLRYIYILIHLYLYIYLREEYYGRVGVTACISVCYMKFLSLALYFALYCTLLHSVALYCTLFALGTVGTSRQECKRVQESARKCKGAMSIKHGVTF